MSDIAFSMSADEKDVVRGLHAIGKATGGVREQIADLVTASKAAGAVDSQLAQQRLSGLTAVLAKQKELKTATDALAKQLKDGTITADQYKVAFEGIAKESDGLKTQLRQLQSQLNEDTADMKKAGVVIGQTEDKTAKYSRAVAELDRLKHKGIMTSKQHASAVAAENAKLTEATEGSSEATGRLDGRFSALAATGVGALAFIHQMAAKLKELRTEMTEDVQQFDKLSRKLGIQGGMSDEERKVQSKIVGEVAFDAAVPIGKAFETATQLNSSGFADPIKGGTLDTALALMQSSNQIDGDAASFIKGSGQFMTAFGMKKDKANLQDLGVRMQGLFKSTDVQAADLPEFAKAAPVLSGAGLTLETSLSTLTALRETMNAGEAATGARNIVSILQTAGVNKPATEALASVGLRPQQVDIQGEGLQKALETLKGATSKLGEADRAGVITQIFGRENAAAASILMNSTDKFDKFAAMQRNAGDSFKADVKTARSGAFADSVRFDVSGQMESMKHEDFATQQELSRAARVSIRHKAALRETERGGVAGTFNAAVFGIGGYVEDNLVRPLTGESTTSLGPQHDREMTRLSGKEFRMPPEMAAEMARQTAVLERIEALNKQGQQQNFQKAHAGIVGNRANDRESR